MKVDRRTRGTGIGILLLCILSGSSFLFGSSFNGTSLHGTPERIVLISIDSCDAGYFERGLLPHTKKLFSSDGVAYGNVLSCMTAETMSGHTTILTGTFPAVSGIFGNGYYDPLTGEDVAVVQDPENRKAQTIFELLRNSGRSTAFISGKWRLPALLAQDADISLSSPVTGLRDPSPRENGRPVFHFEGDAYDSWTLRAALSVITETVPDFTFINLAWLDRTGHDSGTEDFNVSRHLRYLDLALPQFLFDLQSAGMFSDTLFIVTADHGMDGTSRYFNPQRVLEEASIPVDKIHSEGHCAFLFLGNPEGDTERARELLGAHPAVLTAQTGEGLRQFGFDPENPRTGDVFINCTDETVINFKGLPMIYLGMHGGLQTRRVPLYFLGQGTESLLPPDNFLSKNQGGLRRITNADIVPTILEMWNYTLPGSLGGVSLYEK